LNKNAKIYIAGHTGLVGTAITKALREQGYTNFLLRSMKQLDLTSQPAVETFFATEKPEYVFLAAAKVGGIIANNTYRAEFIYDNLMIQNNVIHQAWKHGVKKLLFLGSTCIYPRDCPQPMKEEYLLTGPLEQTNEPYAIAKIAGLKMCENYNRQYGTTFISVMPTNLYGPNDNFDLEKSHVLPALLRKIHLGRCMELGDWRAIRADLNLNPISGISGRDTEEEIREILQAHGVSRRTGHNNESKIEAGQENQQVEIEIWGSGNPLREFMYSEDMAQACIHIMKSEKAAAMIKEDPSFSWINIGTGEEITIRQLAEAISSLTGYTGMMTFNANKPDGTPRKLTSTTRLHSLGYQHKISLMPGLRRMYEAYLEKVKTNSV
jgi:GDP-L-fucose synthase